MAEKDLVMAEKDEEIHKLSVSAKKCQKNKQKQDGGNAKKRVKISEEKPKLSNNSGAMSEKNQEIAENTQALPEKDQLIAENAQVIAEKDQIIAEKDLEIAEKDQLIAKKDRIILRLRMTGAAFMEEAFLRFPHLPEQIFEQLDDGSLLRSREPQVTIPGCLNIKFLVNNY